MNRRTVLCIVAVLAITPPAPLRAHVQDPDAAEIRKLRQLTARESRNGPAWLRLGALLSKRAGEHDKNYIERAEAEHALEQAHEILGEEPDVLLELGLLFRRQSPPYDAARVRLPLEINPFPVGTLAVSDLLLADAQGTARYQAELTVLDQTKRGLATRIFRGAQQLLGGGSQQQPRQRWERDTPVTGDAAVDYLRVEIPDVQPGDYSVVLTVTNLATGATASSARAFRFIRASR